MSKSRKWVTSILVAASMAVVGTASALDDAIVSEMADLITATLATATGSDDQKADAVKAALDKAGSKFDGKVDELIQALADAKIADAVATKVILSEAPTLTLDQVTQNLSAAKIVTETKTSSTPVNIVPAAGNQPPQQQQQVVQQQPSTTPVFQSGGSGTQVTSNTPSSQGAGTGVSRT